MPKFPIRTARCDLTDDYAGFYVVVRTNPPMRIYEEFSSGDFARVLAGMAALTVESNLTDPEGNPVNLSTLEGWREMPQDLLGAVSQTIQAAVASPKATGTGSTTPSSSAEGQSHPTTTS